MQTGVLNVIGGDRLLSFDLYINVHADSSRHSWFVCTLVCEETQHIATQLSQSSARRGKPIVAGRSINDVDWINQLTQIVPDVHLSAESADLDDSLTEEVIWLPLELLLHTRFDVVVLVPYSHLDAVWGVVTFTKQTERESEPQLNIGVALTVGQEEQMSYYHDSLNIKSVKQNKSSYILFNHQKADWKV